MKKMILAIAAVFAMSNAMAQNANTEKKERKQFSQTEMVERQTERQVKQLGLDDTQKAALLKLNTEYAGKLGGGMQFGPRGGRFERNDSAKMERPTEAQMKEMREKMQAERAKMEESQKAYNAELKKILTDEQYTKYEEQQKQMRQRGGRGQGFGRVHGGGQRGQGFPRGQRQQTTETQSAE